MPRHTWTVRVELCETYDAVYAHAYLDTVRTPVSGRGQAAVDAQQDVVRSRSVARRPAHAREVDPETPGYSAAARAAASSSWASAVAN